VNGPKTERRKACTTYVKWSKEVQDGKSTFRVHLVTTWDPRLVHDFGYACNCPEFRTEPGACVHILVVKGYHCGWHQAFDPEPLKDSAVCPRCENPTIDVIWTA